jgi:hypothetical protein
MTVVLNNKVSSTHGGMEYDLAMAATIITALVPLIPCIRVAGSFAVLPPALRKS